MTERQFETHFRVDGSEVAALVRVPASASRSNPVPGIVFVDGSGPSDRHDFGRQPPWFLEAGFAVLTHDKPGCGDTLGDWRQQSIVDRARTTVAALEAMRAVEEVDAGRVGLWGASQGGWVVPLAAAADHRVAFAILVSAAAVSPFEQEAASLEQRMRLGGAPADEIEGATSAFWELVHQLRAFEPPEDLVASLSSDDPRYEYFHAELISEPELISFFSLIGDHDPLPPLQSVRCPVLLIWGELDPLIPVDRSRRAFLEQFESADNRDITVATFPGANHWIMVERPESGSHGEMGFAPGYIETMTDWAKAQTKIPGVETSPESIGRFVTPGEN